MNISHDHQYIGACPVVPSKFCGYQQGELTPYHISRVLLEELDFHGLVNLVEYEQGPMTLVRWSYPPCRSRRNTARGHHWVARLLTLRTTVLRYLERLYRVINEWSTRITP